MSIAWLATACVATLTVDVGSKRAALRELLPLLDRSHTVTTSAAIRRRLGALVGGDEGRHLAEAGRAFFTSRGVVDPDRFCAVLLPGW